LEQDLEEVYLEEIMEETLEGILEVVLGEILGAVSKIIITIKGITDFLPISEESDLALVTVEEEVLILSISKHTHFK
jgi:hypothetical protein